MRVAFARLKILIFQGEILDRNILQKLLIFLENGSAFYVQLEGKKRSEFIALIEVLIWPNRPDVNQAEK